MNKNFIIGQAMEDIKKGVAVIVDAETGKLRKVSENDIDKRINVGYPKIEIIPPNKLNESHETVTRMTRQEIKEKYGL